MTALSPPALNFVQIGSFSGSATSLRDALSARVELRSVDLLRQARDPRMLAARLRAGCEAAAARDAVPWTKTAAWSKALQHSLDRAGYLTGRDPLLVVQTLPALVLDPQIRYAVYTDRVGLEGAAAGGEHRSRFTDAWLEREVEFVRRASRVYVMGPSTLQVLVERYAVPEERIEVVGAGPNTDLGPPRRRSECRRLLFVGVDWERKGGPTLLDAFARLRRERPDLELVVAGGGPHGTVAPPGVIRLGRVPHADIEPVFDDADVMVLPTKMEAFGIVLVEALLKGLPCIHSTVGNQRWIVGDAGEAVVPDDTEALATALRRVIDAFTAYHERAVARGAELRATMSWPAVAERMTAHLLAPS